MTTVEDVRAFTCSRCEAVVSFEDATCSTCGATLGYVPGSSHLHAIGADDAAAVNGERWARCANAISLGCNWLRRASESSAHCSSCSLTIKRPAASDTIGHEQVALAAYAKRRLLFQLHEHALPITPFYEDPKGLGFLLLSSASEGPVTIGHANGVVTIDVSEVDHAYRESLRVRLGEPYRTMLGHFRHEIGHYYWQVLVADSLWLRPFRELFGDERASYADALTRHYEHGAPADWAESYISEYATMHPWEDFAETWAHYLHITDTLQTVASYGMHLDGLAASGLSPSGQTLRTDPPLSPRAYHDMSMREVLDLWYPLAHLFNQVNRSMGKEDLYPFLITEPVREKFGFVHDVIGGAAGKGGL